MNKYISLTKKKLSGVFTGSVVGILFIAFYADCFNADGHFFGKHECGICEVTSVAIWRNS